MDPRRAVRSPGRRAAPGPLAVALALAALAPAARAQVPRPYAPDLRQRSGLITRLADTPPRLPVDPDRDTFLGARYQDEHDPRHLRNCFLNGGMYGKPLSTGCTAAVYPFFPGSPGSSIGPECRRGHRALGRWVGGIFCQLKPVGMYYDRGAYVPIYDLDYPVTGPGPFPWPVFFKRPTGG